MEVITKNPSPPHQTIIPSAPCLFPLQGAALFVQRSPLAGPASRVRAPSRAEIQPFRSGVAFFPHSASALRPACGCHRGLNHRTFLWLMSAAHPSAPRDYLGSSPVTPTLHSLPSGSSLSGNPTRRV